MAEEQQVNPYLLELAKTVGQIALPVTVGTFILNGIDKQIKITKESTEKQIIANKESTEKQIIANKESTEKQIIANKELIIAMKESTEKQIIANKELIIANKESTAESIKASEARIESILLKFTSTLNSRQDRDNRE
jgi:DNA-directed RNA polymerase beta subunit